jgi:tetratricopeptide (TPR) repeat protein
MRVLQEILIYSLAALTFSGFDNNPQSTPSVVSRQAIQKLIDLGRLQEAQQRLKEQVAVQGETPESFFLEGLILFKQRQYDESLQKAERSLALGFRDLEVYKLLAFNGVVLNRLEIVEPALNKALELAPGDFTVHFHLGLLYFTTNRFALAESQFQKAVELNATYMKAYDLLGQAQEEVDKEDAAQKSYRKATELTEQQSLRDESAFLHLAKLLWNKNQYQESLAPAQKAVELNPKSAEAHCVVGRVLEKLGDETGAEKALTRSTEIDADYAEAYYLLSRLYAKQGRQKEAAKALETFRIASRDTNERNEKKVSPGVQ